MTGFSGSAFCIIILGLETSKSGFAVNLIERDLHSG